MKHEICDLKDILLFMWNGLYNPIERQINSILHG